MKITNEMNLKTHLEDKVSKGITGGILFASIVGAIIYVCTLIETKQNPLYFFAELNMIFSVVGTVLCAICGMLSFCVKTRPKITTTVLVLTALFMLISNVHLMSTAVAMLLLAITTLIHVKKVS